MAPMMTPRIGTIHNAFSTHAMVTQLGNASTGAEKRSSWSVGSALGTPG